MTNPTHVTVSRSYVRSLGRALAKVEEARRAYVDSLHRGAVEVESARQRYFDALADMRVVAAMVVESADEVAP